MQLSIPELMQELLETETKGKPMTKSTPDYVYNPDDWEATYGLRQRDALEEELDVRLGDIKKVGTLVEGPTMFVVIWVRTWDEAGDPDYYDVEWFTSEEAAKAAVAAQKKAVEE